MTKDNKAIFKTPSASKIKYFNLIQYHNLIGVGFFHLKQFQLAIEEFNIALR
jgi:hypothetical protein